MMSLALLPDLNLMLSGLRSLTTAVLTQAVSPHYCCGGRGVEPGSPTGGVGGAPLQWSGTSSRTATTSSSPAKPASVSQTEENIDYPTFTGQAGAE